MAAVIALAASCQQAVAPETIVKIAITESHLEPFAIHDNSDGRSYAPATRPEAFRLASALIAAGHRLDVGLTQISAANFPWLRLTLATALDPCTNIAASAEVLTAYSRYNTGTDTKGLSYAMRVQTARFNSPAGTEPTDPAPTEPAPCPQDDPDGWHTVAKPLGCREADPTPCPADDDNGWHTVARPPGCTSPKEKTENEDADK